MMYCPFCGTELAAQSAFCPKCGQRLEIERQDDTFCENRDIATSCSNSKKIHTIAAIVGIVIVLGTAAFLVGRTMDPVRESNGNISMNTDGEVVGVNDAANAVLYLEVYDHNGDVVSTASGFVIEDGKTLITNYHVIDNAYRIVAQTATGERSVDVKRVLAYDKIADLAVLQCEENIGIRPLVLGNSDDVKQGDKVYAVGYPLGLAHTMSDGIISSRYTDEDGTDMLQITAPISNGSSGGALFNSTGEVIGVICASYTSGQNLNLAVSSNTVNTLLNKQTPMLLAEQYIPTYSVEYVIANMDTLTSSLFYVCGWVGTHDYSVTQEDGTEVIEGWAMLYDTPNGGDEGNHIRVRYRNINGVACEALAQVNTGDCLMVKGTLFTTSTGELSMYGDEFKIIQ